MLTEAEVKVVEELQKTLAEMERVSESGRASAERLRARRWLAAIRGYLAGLEQCAVEERRRR